MIVTGSVALSVPPDVFANFPVADEDERLTVVFVPLVVRFPNGSSSETVNGFVALALWAAVRTRRKDELGRRRWVDRLNLRRRARPFDDAVIIGSPATVSP